MQTHGAVETSESFQVEGRERAQRRALGWLTRWRALGSGVRENPNADVDTDSENGIRTLVVMTCASGVGRIIGGRREGRVLVDSLAGRPGVGVGAGVGVGVGAGVGENLDTGVHVWGIIDRVVGQTWRDDNRKDNTLPS